jgi:hypothetical protein
MVEKLLRLINTIRHITLIQFFFQIWYRFKKYFIRITYYKKYKYCGLSSTFKCDIIKILEIRNKEYLLNNEFCFLNVKHSFFGKIDWNFCGHGKLWNYNLQYFNFLLDESISPTERLELLKLFSDDFLNNLVPPEPYPISLRIINSLLFHLRYPIKDEKVKRAILFQINYLENNLEFHILANHLLENAISLFIASFFIEEQKLNKKATKLLLDQLEIQILSDGGHYECSPMYQSILLSRLLLAIDISSQSEFCSFQTAKILKDKAAKMISWIKSYSFPDGTWALMNDAATEVAPTSNQLYSASKALKIHIENLPLKESGFRKLTGKNWEAIVKIGSIQPKYQPGHSHADINSFCLWFNGKHLVVDPGSSTYSVSIQREKERGTSSHNTVSFLGINQSDVWGGFRIGKRAKVLLVSDEPNNLKVSVYFLGNQNYRHTRNFSVFENQLDITDEIGVVNRKLNGIVNFQLGHDISIVKENNDLVLDKNVVIKTDGYITIHESEYAMSFNKILKSRKLSYQISDKLTVSFKFS